MSIFKQTPDGHVVLSSEYLFPCLPEIDITRKQGDAFSIAIVAESGGPELVTFPKGSQIFPNILDELWEIVQAVADPDVEPVFFTDRDFDEVPYRWFCRYCHGEQANLAHAEGEDFPHEPSCMVTKARALVERRKARPKINVKLMVDGKEIKG